MAVQRVTKDSAAALGDLRVLGEGDTIVLSPGARERKDWMRYLDAIASAVGRGSNVGWVR